ncbi:MAG: right-handed parallel beta-helix repeat-containing protein [Phycisphaerales bacterium]|nr:right-handed parallel beta-helix repeat-containing protein [Phycisphaerales bacterium]
MRILLAILSLACSPIALSDDLHVPQDHPTIQDAIDATDDGDRVLVEPGTWVERLDFKSKRISVVGLAGAEETVIDGSGPGRNSVATFKDCSSPEMKIIGLTFTGGKGRNMLPRGEVQGGGILVEDSSPTFVNCIFRDNNAQYGSGGGGSILGGQPIFIGCRFIDNSADFIGGGLLIKEGAPQMIRCTFEGNSASTGGGLYAWRHTHPTLLQCHFLHNTASGYGGGLYTWHSTLALTACTFTGNTGAMETAIASLGTPPELEECTLGPKQSIQHIE